MSNKTINYINQLIERLSKDKQENATYELNQNLELSKMTKKQMLKRGNYIYGINQDTIKDIYINLIFFILRVVIPTNLVVKYISEELLWISNLYSTKSSLKA